MSIKSANLSFGDDENIFLITGENGQGKSTLLEAIMVCMSDHKKAAKFGDYIKTGEDKAHITLNAIIDGDAATFDVTLLKGSCVRSIHYKGVDYNSAERYAEALHTLNLDFYSEIIFAMQASSDIVGMTPAKRSDMLQRVLSFDFSDLDKKLKDEIDANNKIMQEKENEYKSNASFLESLKSISYEKKPLPITAEEATSLYNEVTNLNAQLEENRKNNVLYNEQSKKVNDVYSKVQAAENVKKQAELIIESVKSKIDNLSTYKETKKENESSLLEITKVIDGVDLDIKEADEGVTSMQSIKDTLNTQVLDAKHIVDDLNKRADLLAQGKCPVCGREFDASDSITNQVALKESEATAKILQDELDAAIKSYNELSESLKSLRDKRSTLAVEKAKYETQIAECDKHLNEEMLLQSELADKNAILKKYEEDCAAVNEEYTKEKSFFDSLALAVDDPSILSKIQENNRKISDYNATIEFNKSCDENVKVMNEKKTSTEAANIELLNGIESIKARLKEIANLRDLLTTKLPAYAVVKVCKKISDEMNAFISKAFPNMRISLMQTAQGVDIKYIPDIQENDIMLSTKMASGFQKEIISVAFRVALCRIYNLSFSFFDEIESFGSEANSAIIFDEILSSGIFEQTFIITQKLSTQEHIMNNYLATKFIAKDKRLTRVD